MRDGDEAYGFSKVVEINGGEAEEVVAAEPADGRHRRETRCPARDTYCTNLQPSSTTIVQKPF